MWTSRGRALLYQTRPYADPTHDHHSTCHECAPFLFTVTVPNGIISYSQAVVLRTHLLVPYVQRTVEGGYHAGLRASGAVQLWAERRNGTHYR